MHARITATTRLLQRWLVTCSDSAGLSWDHLHYCVCGFWLHNFVDFSSLVLDAKSLWNEITDFINDMLYNVIRGGPKTVLSDCLLLCYNRACLFYHKRSRALNWYCQFWINIQFGLLISCGLFPAYYRVKSANAQPIICLSWSSTHAFDVYRPCKI